MAAIRRFVRRIYAFLRPGWAEHELTRELQAHLALVEEQCQRQGLSADQAAIAARRALGRVEGIRAMQRDARSFVWLEDVRRDLQYGLRTITRNPGFSGLAVLTLALGIGAVTVIYSVIHNVLLDPLPYPDADRFVNVVVEDLATGRTRGMLSVPELLEYRDRTSVFQDVVGTRGEEMLLTTAGHADPVRSVWVTPNFFPFMGLQPLHGRVLTAAGLGVGLLASVATGRLIASQLWNTSPRDPVMLAAAVALVIVVALAASLVPARRAMRIEPMIALRRD